MEESGNKAVSRALKIIELLSRSKMNLRLQQIAQETDLPESTALRLLNTLKATRYVQQDPNTKQYYMTFKIPYLGQLISSKMSIREVVRPYLQNLSETCKESSCLVVEQDSEALYVDYAEGPDNMLKTLHLIGHVAPLHCTGVGKLLLQNYSKSELDFYVEKTGLAPLTSNSISDKEALIRELKKIRTEGWAIDDEECEEGVRCVAAPILDQMGSVIASISVTGPASRITPERVPGIRDHVMKTAAEVSRIYGA